MQPIDAGDLIVKTLQEDMTVMEATFQKTQNLRLGLAEKLFDVTTNMSMDPSNDRSTVTMAKVSTIGTLTTLLNDIDRQVQTKVNVKMRQKEAEDSNENHGKLVAAMLAQCLGKDLRINPGEAGTVVVTDDDVAARLDQLTQEGTIVIPESEKRDDPSDLS